MNLEYLLEYIKPLVAAGATLVTWLFGAWDMALSVLVSFMVLDYITGVLKAWINKTVSSDVGFNGIKRKALIIIVVSVGVLMDRLLNNGSWVFRTMIAYFYISNEGISLLENCIALGLPVPEKLQAALIQLRECESKEKK